jgi:hypothetical protein
MVSGGSVPTTAGGGKDRGQAVAAQFDSGRSGGSENEVGAVRRRPRSFRSVRPSTIPTAMRRSDGSILRRAAALLVAAVVWPVPTRVGSLVALDRRPYPDAIEPGFRRLHVAALALFPVVFLVFLAVLAIDRATFVALVIEDGVVEWATVAALAVAAVLATSRARAERHRRRAWVFAALAAVCAFVALEEISWGQRIFGIVNPDFFVKYSDQKEINVHNVVQKVTRVAMKWPVGLGYVAYGALLPLLLAATFAEGDASPRWTVARLEQLGVLVPPLALTRGFLLGALLMVDLPTYYEEELAELFGVLALVLLLMMERVRRSRVTR